MKINDAQRQTALEEYGLTVLRFTNEQVAISLNEVINTIEVFIKERIVDN